MVSAFRPEIYKHSKMIRKVRTVNVGPEVPTYRGNAIQRYEVTVLFEVSIQFGFRYTTRDDQLFNCFSVRAVKAPYEARSETGELTEGSNTLTDPNIRFGLDVPFIPKEFNDKYYSIELLNETESHLVIDSVNTEPGEDWGYSVNVSRRQSDGTYVPWAAGADAQNVEYRVAWNDTHILFNYPGAED